MNNPTRLLLAATLAGLVGCASMRDQDPAPTSPADVQPIAQRPEVRYYVIADT